MKLSNALALGTTSFLAAVGVVTFLQTQVAAQSNDCPATPRIGYKCYQDRDIRARSGYPGSDTGRFSYSPPAGYRLMDYRETVHSRFGEGGNLNVDFVRGGAVTQIRRVISDYNKALSDRKSRAESYAQWSIRVGGETETIENALRENNSRLALLEDSYSNVDRVNASVTVSGRCTRVVLGTCADNQGGKYEGTVRFQLEYVGTPGAISAANDAVLRRIDAALQRFEQEAQAIRQQQQQPQQPPPRVEQKACFSVDARQGWQDFVLPRTINSVASIEGGWSVDARSYSMVNHLGHQGAEAERLAPYNDYKYDRRFPFGTLLMDASNQGTIWIQTNDYIVDWNTSFPAGAVVRFRINDADAALGDNAGSLKVCLHSTSG